MGRIVKVSVVDTKGAGAPGQKVALGDAAVTTNQGGLGQALLEDGDIVITVNGVKAYEGPVADLRPTEVFTVAGARVP